ncbi:MAG: DUF2336 domain-containing protein [Alphaproteobacteria bacterium]|nr:DUF2336 domain-containing protein [Alphaproteobacteria bacterium]
MLKRLISKLSGQEPGQSKMSYEEARAALESHALKARRFLAGRPDVEPEILYFLAGDEEADVRRMVAGNPATPHQANKVLTGDGDDEVRCELARKIGRLLPGMEVDETHRVRDLAIEVMERLARDSLPRVRAILAEEIKSSDRVPAHIVKQLAQDVELIVSAPVLEYSPLLSDDDLIEIIAGARVEGTLAAIARRASVNAPVADAIVASLDVSAVAALLANPNAQIREEALDKIIEHAAAIEAWHQPIVMRADLSVRAVRRIAGFVGSALLSVLCQRSGLDEETAVHLNKRVRERLEAEGLADDGQSADAKAQALVQEAQAQGKLDDEFVLTAADGGDRRAVVFALSALAGVPKTIVERVLISQSGKAITALVWRAKLSMRTAVKVQTAVAHLPSGKILMAREGVHFPLPAEEMAWHLGFFGING